jgi:hypothetical protein
MAHYEQRVFFETMRERFPDAFSGASVLEVGSLNINGTVRDFFLHPREYVGVDLLEGPGVDRVCAGQDLDYADGSFDVVVSAECFEHNSEWVATFANMARISGRYVFFTCASTGRAEHGTHGSHPGDSPATNDYYRNLSAQDFRDAFDLSTMFAECEFEFNPRTCDLYFYGVKLSKGESE